MSLPAELVLIAAGLTIAGFIVYVVVDKRRARRSEEGRPDDER
jgi:hypothetical protein